MTTQLSTETYCQVHFAVIAIEASAKKKKISGQEMHDRLKKTNNEKAYLR